MSASNIIIRIDDELKKLFIKTTEDISKNINIGYSFVLRKLIEDYIKNKKKDINIKLQQEIKNYLYKKKGLKLKQKQKEKLFMYYLISNTIKSIYKLSSSFLINSGDLNMEVVNKVVDGAIEIYNNYPEDIKNDLKVEIDSLKELKNRDKLIGKMKIIRLLTLKKQMKDLDEK